MPLPEHLERLKHISIDTLGLSESTLAVLKWNGITHVLDCIAYFYTIAQERDRGGRSHRLVRLMFSEVKPALITSGYWDLVLDADVWRIFREQNYKSPPRRIVPWKEGEVDLCEISLEQLGPYDDPLGVRFFFKDIGRCIGYFLYNLSSNSKSRLKIDKYSNPDREPESGSEVDEYMWGHVQPRLVELGYWHFVEEHVDDFDFEAEVRIAVPRVLVNEREIFERADNVRSIPMILLQWLIAPIRTAIRYLRGRV